MESKISIIVPVYNIEKYIEKCAISIINQTYKNIEIFLVDDGSTDESGKKCDDLKKIDDRIIVIHKTNGGLSDARNIAIEKATGNYITFIDGDDYIDDNYIECLYKLITDFKADISCVQFFRVLENGFILDKYNNNNDIKVYNSEEAIELTLYQKRLFNSAWGKLYKKELFKDIRYPFGKLSEDLGTTYKVFDISKRIVVSQEKKYYYLQRSSSIMKSEFNIRKLDSLAFAREIKTFVKTKYRKLEAAANSRICSECIGILELLIKTLNVNNVDIEKDIYKELKKCRLKTIFNFKSNLKLRIKLIKTFFTQNVEYGFLKRLIQEDKQTYLPKNKMKRIIFKAINHQNYIYYKALVFSRKYRYYRNNKNSIINKLKFLYYFYKKNNMTNKYSIELNGANIGAGLKIYHNQIVINHNSIIGNNVELHGNNCIGNDGKTDLCPIIGERVEIGYGASIVGNVKIANGIKIGANSIITKDFLEENIIIAGNPAKKI